MRETDDMDGNRRKRTKEKIRRRNDKKAKVRRATKLQAYKDDRHPAERNEGTEK